MLLYEARMRFVFFSSKSEGRFFKVCKLRLLCVALSFVQPIKGVAGLDLPFAGVIVARNTIVCNRKVSDSCGAVTGLVEATDGRAAAVRSGWWQT